MLDVDFWILMACLFAVTLVLLAGVVWLIACDIADADVVDDEIQDWLDKGEGS